MSLSKLGFFTTLAVLIALTAVRRLDVETKFDVLTPNSHLSHPAVTHDESLWYAGSQRISWSDRTGHSTR